MPPAVSPLSPPNGRLHLRELGELFSRGVLGATTLCFRAIEAVVAANVVGSDMTVFAFISSPVHGAAVPGIVDAAETGGTCHAEVKCPEDATGEKDSAGDGHMIGQGGQDDISVFVTCSCDDIEVFVGSFCAETTDVFAGSAATSASAPGVIHVAGTGADIIRGGVGREGAARADALLAVETMRWDLSTCSGEVAM